MYHHGGIMKHALRISFKQPPYPIFSVKTVLKQLFRWSSKVTEAPFRQCVIFWD